MNSFTKRMLMEKMRKGKDKYDSEDRYPVGRRYDIHTYDDRDYRSRKDHRRYEDDDDYEDEENEMPKDIDDTVYLEKSDMAKWKRMLKNSDGTTGPHFELNQIIKAADALGIQFKDFDELELCMTANMLYSDFCEELKAMIPMDKEAMRYTGLAKAWLCDKDGPEPSEKLAIYYHCIAKDS